jgi:hypothetical protein
MKGFIKYFIAVLLFFCFHKGISQSCFIKGKVTNQNGKVIELVAIKLDQYNAAFTNKYGEFELKLQKNKFYTLHTYHLSFESYVTQLNTSNKDTIDVLIKLKERTNYLDTIAVFATHKPETLVGKPNYGVYDFDFYEDKLILLTAKRSLQNAELKLTDYTGKEFMSFAIPKEAGEAQKLMHDHMGYTNLLCKDSIFRIEIINQMFVTYGVSKREFEQSIKPVNDTANGHLYFNDQNINYPMFNYFYIHHTQPQLHKRLYTVINKDLMELYNWEYYYLPPRGQLEARKIAQEYHVDKKVVAAMMSGFTKSLFYEPLYAPLFIINDTINLFDHHTDQILHFDKENKLIDSVKISYHHPKKWRTWKKQLFYDGTENKVYALFKNGANVFIKRIDHMSGKIEGVHKFVNITADRIKIKDGYAYYIYRPFESTQEKFLYREVIQIKPEE